MATDWTHSEDLAMDVPEIQGLNTGTASKRAWKVRNGCVNSRRFRQDIVKFENASDMRNLCNSIACLANAKPSALRF